MLCVFNSFAELGPIKLKHKRVSREDLDNFKGFKAFCRLLVMGKKRMRVVKYCKPLKNFLIVILDYNSTSEFSHVCVSLYLYEREIHWSHLNSDIESINASLSISMAKQVLLDSYALYQCKVSKPHFSNNPMMALIQEGRGFQQTWLFPVRQLRHKQNSGGWRQIGTCEIGCRGWSWAGEPQQHFIPWVLYCHLLGLKTGWNQAPSEEHTEGNSPTCGGSDCAETHQWDRHFECNTVHQQIPLWGTVQPMCPCPHVLCHPLLYSWVRWLASQACITECIFITVTFNQSACR